MDLLRDFFIPYVEEEFPGNEPLYFVHDQSRIHQANDVQFFFAEINASRMQRNLPIIQLIPWPSKGADLNPIENIWAMMITDMEARHIRNPFALFENVEQIWEGYRYEHPNLCQRLAYSMESRIELVLGNNGYWCGY